MNSRVLVIGDLHSPYMHKDAVPFLTAIKKKYKPDLVIQIGDEVDHHAMNFHDHDPDLPSAGDELERAIKRLLPIYKLFPHVEVIESNHGSMVYRKAVSNGMPRSVFKSYRDMLRAPKGWKWSPDLILKLSNGAHCYFHHGKSAAPMALSHSMSMSAVSGHHHPKFCVNYWANPLGLYFQAFTGCLVDDKSLALAYNKTDLLRPIIGSLIILDGHPKLLPLVKDRNGRWIKKLV